MRFEQIIDDKLPHFVNCSVREQSLWIVLRMSWVYDVFQNRTTRIRSTCLYGSTRTVISNWNIVNIYPQHIRASAHAIMHILVSFCRLSNAPNGKNNNIERWKHQRFSSKHYEDNFTSVRMYCVGICMDKFNCISGI